MKYTVDGSLCTGHGRCYTVAPTVYAPDDEGYNLRRGDSVEVSPGQDGDARRGARVCPERAIELAE
ncbi:ferredoxin [Streptomyces acidicola]|uniref:Ferredoxin n=1 Tax=Streptomyces acidicola TaxID=2596892 RepID=A0A5N8WJ75_9ACTN|nr:ferredoxin [Streptomyces acidicola]MPY47500.1 ferredoxin [Streptomyces acidicola]